MLPSPTLTFTIPSVHDNVVLQCRIYHPACLSPTSISQITGWNNKAAIVAHPYAVLGGCYDDPVVNIVSATILKQGFVVGTFNFRGAGKGKTSWTSEGEKQDYLSFVAFMIYYIHHLSPPPIPLDLPKFTHSDPELHNLSPIQSHALPHPNSNDTSDDTITLANPELNAPAIAAQNDSFEPNTQPRLLLAGYSYGALITASLPPIIHSIISTFQTPLPGSPHAEIRLRAESLAAQQNEIMQNQITTLLNRHFHRRGRSLHADDILSSPKLRKASGGVRMGGEEDLRRASHDSYRSRHSFTIDTPDVVRKSMDRVRSIGKSKRESPKTQNTKGSVGSTTSKLSQYSIEKNVAEDEAVTLKAISDIGVGLQTAYLIVSPVLGLVGNLLTLWKSRSSKDSITENEMKFAIDPTLALFGDDDTFISVKRLRAWAGRLTDAAGAKEKENNCLAFRYTEVEGAGHFWSEHEAIGILRREVESFVKTL